MASVIRSDARACKGQDEAIMPALGLFITQYLRRAVRSVSVVGHESGLKAMV